jgi:two-component system cell cycle sensor histidine kinase/response regulator CckA
LFVLGDRDQLTRVVLNLVYNACEAMPNGGQLTLTSRKVETANPLTPARMGWFVELRVSDTGMGMPAEIRERVFEPLFSTKPRSDDGPRGLGLAVVYAAVNQAGGFLQVQSNPGSGTTFQVFLPLHG